MSATSRQRCIDQLDYSLPFYVSLGFASGALLFMLYCRYKGQLMTRPLLSHSSAHTAHTIDEHDESPDKQTALEEKQINGV